MMSTCVICNKKAEYNLKIKTLFIDIFVEPIPIEFDGSYCGKHLTERCKTIISVLSKKKKKHRKKSKRQKRKKYRKRK